MIRKQLNIAIAALLLMMAAATSCIDDRYFVDGVGDGMSEVDFSLTFRPASNVNVGTRGTAGDAIREIKNLFVVWYDSEGNYKGSKFFNTGDMTITDADRTGIADPSGETVTQHAEGMKCNIPFGRYRIYAVVNMGDLTGRSELQKEVDFKNISFTWNAGDVASNCQMSGYFATSNDTQYASGDAPLVTINKDSTTLHSWLRRAASKVTLAFDASELNENIYIYIDKAELKDVPKTCKLINDNTPQSADELIANGESISYANGSADYHQWLTLSKGNNYYGNHANNAESMFFYENLQGTHPNKHIYNNFKNKDNVPYGTYIEVTGYYVNNGSNPSSGKIIYRCMLGKNMVDDFNSVRNAHYKVTLKFKHDANDPDWHIVYDYQPAEHDVTLPNPMYISYLPNQPLEMPVTLNYNKDIYEVNSISAEITKNNWGYEDHKYYYNNDLAGKATDGKGEDSFGFLSLELNQNAYSYSKDYSGVTRETTSTGAKLKIPVYTRKLAMSQGCSGANIWVGRQRYAKVAVTVVYKKKSDGSLTTATKEVDIIQVARLVNPTGVWRSSSSTNPFRVTLQTTTTDAFFAKDFTELKSDGPWTAHIERGADWVQIRSIGGTWGTADVVGSTGSSIDFEYRPGSSNSNSSPRFGLIKVTYHNNTCVHMILVSQGVAGKEGKGTVLIDGRNWHMSNVKYAGVDEENPLLEGSMFKFGTSSVAYKSLNNLKSGYGFPTTETETDDRNLNKSFECYDLTGGTITKNFREVGIDPEVGFDSQTMTSSGTERVANPTDWTSLMDESKFDRYYGILYGDECASTVTTNDAAAYTNVGDVKGMLGCFIFEKSSGNYLFFPMGNTGHGRRQYLDHSPSGETKYRWGDLKYADRTVEMPEATAKVVPPLYNLWIAKGAIYWYGVRTYTGQTAPASDNSNEWRYAFDINFMTYGFEPYQTNHVYINSAMSYGSTETSVTNSDACFVRRISN